MFIFDSVFAVPILYHVRSSVNTSYQNQENRIRLQQQKATFACVSPSLRFYHYLVTTKG